MGNYISPTEDRDRDITPPESTEQLVIDNERKRLDKLMNYGLVPVDILNIILQYLSYPYLLKCTRVCKLFYHLVNCNLFWNEYYENNFKTKCERIKSKNLKKEFFEVLGISEHRDFFYKHLFKFQGDINKDQHVNQFQNEKDVVHFRIVVDGRSNVGKTTLIKLFCGERFSDSHPCTLGYPFVTIFAKYSGRKFMLDIWDTINQESSNERTIRSYRYRRADGCLLCFSFDDRKSFDNIDDYVKDIQVYGSKDTQVLIVGCKSDIKGQRPRYAGERTDFTIISDEMVMEMLERNGMKVVEDYVECSSKEGKGVQFTFGLIFHKILRSIWKKQVAEKN